MKYTVLVAISLYVWAASVLASAVEAEALPSSSLPVAVSGLPIGLKLGDTTDVWVERDTTREHELLLGFCIVGVVYVVLKMYGRGWSGADVVVGISMICIALIVAASAVQDASRVEIVLHRGQGEHNALIITRSNLRGDEWRTFTPMSNVFIEFRQPKETGLPSVDDSEEEDPDFDIFVIGEQDSEVLFSSAYYSEAEAQYRAWTTYLDTYRGPGRYESFVPHHTLNTNPQL